MNQILTDEDIDHIREDGAYHKMMMGPIEFARAIESAILSKLNSAEPVHYEYRWLDTNEHTVTSGQWSDWEIVKRRSCAVTVEDRVAEIQYYIDKGYRYELRKLFTYPPAPSVANISLTGEGKTNQLADFIHRFKRHVGGDGEPGHITDVPKPPEGYTAEELERDNPYNQWMYEK